MDKKLYNFSVIIPAHNEEKYIAACVKSLKAQKYTGKFEIIVVDTASSDNTAVVARNAGARVIHEMEQHVSAARRQGSAYNTGEIKGIFEDVTKITP